MRFNATKSIRSCLKLRAKVYNANGNKIMKTFVLPNNNKTGIAQNVVELLNEHYKKEMLKNKQQEIDTNRNQLKLKNQLAKMLYLKFLQPLDYKRLIGQYREKHVLPIKREFKLTYKDAWERFLRRNPKGKELAIKLNNHNISIEDACNFATDLYSKTSEIIHSEIEDEVYIIKDLEGWSEEERKFIVIIAEELLDKKDVFVVTTSEFKNIIKEVKSDDAAKKL